jgi:proteasome lid subunit RPN8/RPN11
MKFLAEMYKAAKESAPREMCGLVVRQNDTEKWILCENISEDKDDFEIDPKVFVQYQLTSKILYVVHSHYDENNCNAVNIPYLIVGYPQKKYITIEPK